MPDWIRDSWAALTPEQRGLVIIAFVTALLLILVSYIFLGTDYSGFGDWVRGLLE